MQSPTEVRGTIRKNLGILEDSRLLAPAEIEMPDDAWDQVTESFESLRSERTSFFVRHDYGWAFSRDAYESPFEALLQWRLLNVLADIPEDHPDQARAGNIAVRVVPNLSGRAHIRRVEGLHVIVLPFGYLSSFRAFVRVWFKGRGLARPLALEGARNYSIAAEHFLLAVKHRQPALVKGIDAYVGHLFILAMNQLPPLDTTSVFDDPAVDRASFEREFSQMANSVDGFVLFHETAHILRAHTSGLRETEQEVATDRLAVSLSIMDQARWGGGSVVQGGILFYRTELLRCLAVETLGRLEKKIQGDGRLPGMSELMMRSRKFEDHLVEFLPRQGVQEFSRDFSNAMTLVFDAAKWGMLRAVNRSRSQLEGPYDLPTLADFLDPVPARSPSPYGLWTPVDDLVVP